MPCRTESRKARAHRQTLCVFRPPCHPSSFSYQGIHPSMRRAIGIRWCPIHRTAFYQGSQLSQQVLRVWEAGLHHFLFRCVHCIWQHSYLWSGFQALGCDPISGPGNRYVKSVDFPKIPSAWYQR